MTAHRSRSTYRPVGTRDVANCVRQACVVCRMTGVRYVPFHDCTPVAEYGLSCSAHSYAPTVPPCTVKRACARQQTYRARTHAHTHTQIHSSVLRNTRRAIEIDRLLAKTYASRVIVVAVDDEHWERYVQVGIVKVDCSRCVSQPHRLVVTGAMVARTGPCGSSHHASQRAPLCEPQARAPNGRALRPRC